METKKRAWEPRICECADHAFAYANRVLTVLVSASDMGLLEEGRWSVNFNKPGTFRIVRMGAQRKLRKLHQVVSALKGADHINRNSADNRRTNLRPANSSLQIFNQNKRKTYRLVKTSSRFKGVSREKNSWDASIRFNGKKIRLGRYKSEEDAARAYDRKASEICAEFAVLNFPEAPR